MENLSCDICGRPVDRDNVGFMKNDGDGLVVRCNKCHSPDRREKKTSYRNL